MRLSEVREKFLEFYRARGHAIISSASLIPENDPTTLFTGSGMQPLVPYLLGEKHPLGKRIANSQKSFRAEDIDEVGDNRHTTFFEMLGNWSFGDYFKEEQLPWFFDFLTNKEEGVGLDPNRLYVSVFAGDPASGVPRDDESVLIWKRLFKEKGTEARDIDLATGGRGEELGMQGGRIFYYDAKKNWWSRAGAPEHMPAGEPGGPDSEVFYDFGTAHDPKFGKECHPNCDCGRFLEVGNSVFMEYKKSEDGSFEKLAQRNVDFGGGLERITMAVNDEPDMFRIDALHAAVEVMEGAFGVSYEGTGAFAKPFRIIADHLRAAVFLLSDGVLPSNKERGYVLRRFIRRAAFAAYRHGARDSRWSYGVVAALIAAYRNAYRELTNREKEITEELSLEIERFYETLEAGLRIFEEIKKTSSDRSIDGAEAFKLFATYGFPLELTKERAAEEGMTVDEDGFKKEFEKHQDLSRTATAGVFKGGLADQSAEVVRLHTTTHLLNAALRRVLGDHVWQKGSNITKERTRFDFTHSEKLTEEQKKEVERLVNEWIQADYVVKKEILPLAEARTLGAIGVFGEKYPDMVNVYTVWDPKTETIVSREFCGGPHVTHTEEIGGTFRIVKEEAVAAGIRRIKGIVG